MKVRLQKLFFLELQILQPDQNSFAKKRTPVSTRPDQKWLKYCTGVTLVISSMHIVLVVFCTGIRIEWFIKAHDWSNDGFA